MHDEWHARQATQKPFARFIGSRLDSRMDVAGTAGAAARWTEQRRGREESWLPRPGRAHWLEGSRDRR